MSSASEFDDANELERVMDDESGGDDRAKEDRRGGEEGEKEVAQPEVSIARARIHWYAQMSKLAKNFYVEAEAMAAQYERTGDVRDQKLSRVRAMRDEITEHIKSVMTWGVLDPLMAKKIEFLGFTKPRDLEICYSTAKRYLELISVCRDLTGTDNDDDVLGDMMNRVREEKQWKELMETDSHSDWLGKVRKMKVEMELKDSEISRLKRKIDILQLMDTTGPDGCGNVDQRIQKQQSSEVQERNDGASVLRRMYELNLQRPGARSAREGISAAVERHRSRERSPSVGEWQRPRSTASSDYGSSVGDTRVLEKLLKAQITSNVSECTAHTLEDFEIYHRRFESRYECLDEFERKDQLILLLRGATRKIYERLPRNVRMGEYKELVDGIKDELRGDSRLRVQRATEKLRTLTMERGKLKEYCDELERLTSITYEGIPSDVLSRVRAAELWSQIRHGAMGTALVDTYETTDPDELYATLRTKAFRMERQLALPSSTGRAGNSRDTGQRLGGFQTNRYTGDREKKGITSSFGSERRQNADRHHTRVEQDNRHHHAVPTWSHTSSMKCYNCQELGHYADRCPKKGPQQQTRSQCYECQGYGHNARDCPKRRGSGANATPLGNRAGAVFVTNHDSHSETKPTITQLMRSLPIQKMEANGVSTVSESSFSPLYGEKCLRKVEFLGQTRNMLIDSGAQPSLIQYGWLQDADRRGVCLETELEGVDSEGQGVFNVSGGQMKVLCIVSMMVQLPESNRRARIPFHVVDEGVNATKEPILGTNAFKALGIEIVLRSGNDSPYNQNSLASGGEKRAKSPTSGGEILNNKGEQKSALASGGETPYTKGTHFLVASVVNRVVIDSGQAASVTIASTAEKDGTLMLLETGGKLSDHKCILEGVGVVKEGRIEFWANNPFSSPVIFRKGQVVGTLTPVVIVDSMKVNATEMLDEWDVKATDGKVKEKKLLDMLLKEKDQSADYGDSLKGLLREFSDVFATEDAELKQTTWVEHSIDTGDASPIRQKCRPVPLGVKEKFREILKGLLDRGIIEKSTSPWASPIVLVKKKDGSIRLCIDFRELNKAIKLDSYPLPSIDILLQQLNGKSVFSTLDLHSGFWQIGLHEESRPKTAFICTEGLYQFRVLPFGLATSPATFQRMMDEVLRDLVATGDVNIYVDDILIATESTERHVKVLREVFLALRKANLAIRAQKSRLFEREVPYLGHLISGSGVQTDPKKVAAIREYKTPTNVAEMRTFLGMAGYYRKFVHKFARIAQPLFNLTKQGVKWNWGSDQQLAFEKLKDVMCKAPILVQPDMNAALDGSNPFIIFTDASGIGVGGVLTQADKDGYLHPVAFASKGLNKTESNYHVTDLEALAIVYCVKKFNHFLYGAKNTVVRTDHQALVSLFKRSVTGRLLRWSMIIQDAQVQIEYVKGKANVIADALSRGVPVTKQDSIVHEGLETVVIGEVTVAEGKAECWLDELKESEIFSSIILALEEGKVSGTVDLPGVHRKYKVSDFEIENGCLFLWKDPYTKVKVVPEARRRALFDEVHTGKWAGHFAASKLIKMISQRYFWETLAKDVSKWYSECVKCFIDNHRQKLVPPLKPWITAKPYELVGIDIMELGMTEQGNRYVVTVIDHFSKWAGAYPVPDKKAETVAKVIVQRWIGEGGRWPKQFLSDQGGEFVNAIVEKIQQMTGINWVTTKGYLPRENGLTERFNGTLQRALRKTVGNPSDWDQILPFIIYAYNTAPHESTGESPFFLLHGFDPTLVTEKEVPKLTLYMVDRDDYLTSLVDSINRAQELAKEKNEAQRMRMKAWYDKKFGTERKIYPTVGERVFMRVPGGTTKSQNPKMVFDVTGPFRVLEVSDNSALISEIGAKKEPLRIQFDLLLRIPEGLGVAPLDFGVKKGRKKVKKGHIGVNSVQVYNSVCFRRPLSPQFTCQREVSDEEEPCQWERLTLRQLVSMADGSSLPSGLGDVPLRNYTVLELVRVAQLWGDERLWSRDRVEKIRRKEFPTTQIEGHILLSTWISLTKICRCCAVDVMLKVQPPETDAWNQLVAKGVELERIWKSAKLGEKGLPVWTRQWKDVWIIDARVAQVAEGRISADFGYIFVFTEENLKKIKNIPNLRRIFFSLPFSFKSGELESSLDMVNYLGVQKGVQVIVLTPLVAIEKAEEFRSRCADLTIQFNDWKMKNRSEERAINLVPKIFNGHSEVLFGSHASSLRIQKKLIPEDVVAYGTHLGFEMDPYLVRHMFRPGHFRLERVSPSVSPGVEPGSHKRRGCDAFETTPLKRPYNHRR